MQNSAQVKGPDHDAEHALPERQVDVSDGEKPTDEPERAKCRRPVPVPMLVMVMFFTVSVMLMMFFMLVLFIPCFCRHYVPPVNLTASCLRFLRFGEQAVKRVHPVLRIHPGLSSPGPSVAVCYYRTIGWILQLLPLPASLGVLRVWSDNGISVVFVVSLRDRWREQGRPGRFYLGIRENALSLTRALCADIK
jgi:hypothetical protein